MVGKILNFLGMQLGWFLCVVGPVKNNSWLGPLYVAVFLGFNLIRSARPRREAGFILAVGAVGTAIDTVHNLTGFLGYVPDALTVGNAAPMWITALWMLFAGTFGSSMLWLQNRYMVAGVMGAVSGPLGYLAGSRLGAISFKQDPAVSMCVLGIVWGIVVPGLVWASGHVLDLKRRDASVPSA